MKLALTLQTHEMVLRYTLHPLSELTLVPLDVLGPVEANLASFLA